MGIAAKDVQTIIGKTLNQSVSKRDFVQFKDFNS
jgi:hypothetical protein